MLLTPHTLVGVAIAASVPNPIIAVPLAFVSHFLGDLVPHWDFFSHTKREERTKGWRILAVMMDMAFGVAVSMYFTLYALWRVPDPQLAITIFFSALASVLPDALTGPAIYVPGLDGFFEVVHKLQGKLQFQAPLPWGIISQIIVIGICLVLISNSIGLK